MRLTIRSVVADDAADCGRVLYAAFARVADQHNFPHDFPSVEIATGVAEMLITGPGFYGVVVERDGHILGSNFLDERTLTDRRHRPRSPSIQPNRTPASGAV